MLKWILFKYLYATKAIKMQSKIKSFSLVNASFNLLSFNHSWQT